LNFVNPCWVGPMNIEMYSFPNYRRNLFKVLFILFILLNGSFPINAGNGLSNYKVFFAAGQFRNQSILVIRKFEQSGQQFYVGVYPDNLETQIIPSNQVSLKELTWQQILDGYSNTAYIRAIRASRISSGYCKQKNHRS
jgi:hypothetical protein